MDQLRIQFKIRNTVDQLLIMGESLLKQASELSDVKGEEAWKWGEKTTKKEALHPMMML